MAAQGAEGAEDAAADKAAADEARLRGFLRRTLPSGRDGTAELEDALYATVEESPFPWEAEVRACRRPAEQPTTPSACALCAAPCFEGRGLCRQCLVDTLRDAPERPADPEDTGDARPKYPNQGCCGRDCYRQFRVLRADDFAEISGTIEKLEEQAGEDKATLVGASKVVAHYRRAGKLGAAVAPKAEHATAGTAGTSARPDEQPSEAEKPKPKRGVVKRARVKLRSSAEELAGFQLATTTRLDAEVYMRDGRPMCTEARNMIVQRSTKWLKRRGGPQRRAAASATPLTLDDLASATCCSANCWKQRGLCHPKTLVRFSEKAHTCSGANEKRRILEELTVTAPHLCTNARSILCDMDPRTVQATDTRFEEEIATGEERGFVHGNTGWEPVNRLEPRLIAKIQDLINK